MALPLPLARLYLLGYNTLQWLGWAIAFFQILREFTSSKSTHVAYAAAGHLICFLQTLSFLEVLHSATGLVRSGVATSLLQWGGRTHLLLAIVRPIAEVQELPSLFITFIAWSLSECMALPVILPLSWFLLCIQIIRYGHYVLSGMEICPSWITYLRYTAFIFLYPIGVGPGEMWLIYESLPFIEEKNLYSKFFKNFSVTFHSFVMIVLLFYPFLWLKLYLHLFKLRRYKLGKDHKKAA